MASPGEILLYSDFEFEDHSRGDKLFIILNAADTGSPALVLNTTSRARRYEGVVRGCNQFKKVFFVPATWGNCFRVDTYVQLPQIFEIAVQDLLAGHLRGHIRSLGLLPGDCLLQLKSCLKQFRQDISRASPTLLPAPQG
ncbi:MAG: hypothetical protein HY673_14870 [Chloroflexi bacterium]|nr:hypothetical protein [Chloroflexota bacterium]